MVKEEVTRINKTQKVPLIGPIEKKPYFKRIIS